MLTSNATYFVVRFMKAAPGRYRSDRLEAIAPLGRMRFVVENGRVTGFEVLVEDQVRFSAQRTQ